MKNWLLAFTMVLSLLLGSNAFSWGWYGGNFWRGGNWHRGGSTFYYSPGYYYPYTPYYTYPSTVIYRDNSINSCQLMPSYYDQYGNWVPPTRICQPS